MKYDVYADIECTMSLSDREFIELITLNFAIKIRKLTFSILIRDIENKIYNSDEYILINNFIKETLLNNTSAIAFFQREVHLINDLKMKMFIDIDILNLKWIEINLNDRILQINSCQDIIIKINIVTRKKANLKRIVKSQEKIIISSHVFLKILVKIKDLSKNQDFIFESKYDQNMTTWDDLYAHIVNVSLFFVQLQNDIDQSLTIHRYARLEFVTEYNEDECFLANSINNHLVTIKWKHKRASWKKSIDVTMLVIIFALDEIIKDAKKLTSVRITLTVEQVLSNEITIFDNEFIFTQILNMMTFYLKIWTDQSTIINVSEKNWMSITLKSEVIKQKTFKVYSLSIKDKDMIDKIFDKLHA